MRAFVDTHRSTFGVEPICSALQIAPSGYRRHAVGIQGVRRGKVVRTTVSDSAAPCPLDKVNRQFRAERPNQLWVSDLKAGVRVHFFRKLSLTPVSNRGRRVPAISRRTAAAR